MRSSYLSSVDFGDIIGVITQLKNPKRIVEFGLLDGFSLKNFSENCSEDCIIKGYDIFEDFVGNSANYKDLSNKFKGNNNINILKGNFYESVNLFDDNSIDILHVDIANDGNVYEFAINNYIKKIKQGGILMLEGGSNERDNVDWMIKYNKKPIKQVLEKYTNKYKIFTIDKFPSMTLIFL